MGAEEDRQTIDAFGLEKDISKKKIRSSSWRRLRGKGKRKNTCLWEFQKKNGDMCGNNFQVSLKKVSFEL